jgi:hypothetical protein
MSRNYNIDEFLNSPIPKFLNSNDMIFIKNLQEKRLIYKNRNKIDTGKVATLLIGNNSDDLI